MIFIKPALFALLAINAGIYAAAGRFSEGLDAWAWVALLILFEIETRCAQWTRVPRNAFVLDLLRLAAAAAVTVAAFSFIRENEWLDAVNAWLWIGVVVVLELQVRAPALMMRHHRSVALVSSLLYAALAVVAAIWLAQGDWFEGYDAALWIAAFALIELDLLRLAASPADKISN